MGLPKMKSRGDKPESPARAPEIDGVLDDEIESEIRRWKSLSADAQRKRLKAIEESFGVGGP